ncbi:IS110 family transposase [Pseudomonadota bacterium]
MKITSFGLDIAKNVFHLVGLNQANKVGLKKRLRRSEVIRYFSQQPVCTIGMEACAASNYWGRELKRLGHQVHLIPAQHVKPLVRGQKNDFNDALAIAEALGRPGMRFVPVKSVTEQDAQALHRIREGAISARTALVNRVRGLLAEYGIVFPKGIARLRRALPELMEDADNGLSADFRFLLDIQYQQLCRLDEQIKRLTDRVQIQVRVDEDARRLLSIPGFGPIVASVWRARMGNGHQFRRGRDASASVGLVPRQHSTGGKTTLLGITKRGDPYLRCLLIHGARAVVRSTHKKSDPLSQWITRLVQRRGIHIATVALANKLARIAWAVTVNQTPFEPQRAA